ncbi:peptidase U32 family protein [Lapidilactobacillus achengensis]|uniref:Peptidase U32 family protein n=1 Tax=Lapidilactobacillus achengensis TaxID=2486000 RepID=A0ABW1UQU6_9LACO|nr:peptidase U32 family protein [Lapidilactobacillus achengensis]
MSELVTTVSSYQQAAAVIAAGADRLYLGEDEFGLRLPHSFAREELAAIVTLAHQEQKKVTVAANAIFHNDRIAKIDEYFRFLAAIGVDEVSIGDPGAINVLRRAQLNLPYLYDAADLVTSSRQINFWGKHGAHAAVLAHEVPYQEMMPLSQKVTIPVEVTVYGAIVIHQSGRPLLDNYSNFVQEHLDRTDRQRGLFIATPHHDETHYSIYEDRNGTHIFANNDLDLLPDLPKLWDLGLRRWKLDGLFADEATFPQVVAAFAQARALLAAGTATAADLAVLDQTVQQLQPAGRGLDNGFFDLDPDEVK